MHQIHIRNLLSTGVAVLIEVDGTVIAPGREVLRAAVLEVLFEGEGGPMSEMTARAMDHLHVLKMNLWNRTRHS